MSSSFSSSRSNSAISGDATIRGLVSGIEQIDTARADNYSNLLIVKAAKAKQLARQQKIYETQYGADDSTVATIKAKLNTNAAIQRELSVAQVQAATSAPTANPNGYVLYGFVRNPQRAPQANLTVALYNANGKWAQQFGYGCTDTNGYFTLNSDSGSAGDPASGQNPSGAKAEAANEGWQIRVSDPQKKILYKDPDLLRPKLGAVDYREIILSDGDCNCTPPSSPTATPPAAPSAPQAPIEKPAKNRKAATSKKSPSKKKEG